MSRDNRFRFNSYKEEIKEKVIISLKSGNYVEDDEELDSYFATSVERWSSSNTGEHFMTFRKRIAPFAVSLKLVHLNQKTIVNELLRFLESSTYASTAPFLDLVGSLCCDLRDDFLPYLEEFLPRVFKLIQDNYKDADILQQSFNCLAHLIYFLHRPLTKDVTQTLRIFFPILLSKASHISAFAAECLAFILRKISNRYELLSAIMHAVTEDYKLGGILLAEVLRGPPGKLHTSAYEILPIAMNLVCGLNSQNHVPSRTSFTKGISTLLKQKRPKEHAEDNFSYNLNSNSLSEVLVQTFSHLLDSLDADGIIYILTLLTEVLQQMNSPNFCLNNFNCAVSILRSVFLHCKPVHLVHTEEHLGSCLAIALKLSASDDLLNIFAQFIREPIQRYNPFNQLRLVLLDSRFSIERRMQFLMNLSDWSLFDRDVLPNIGSLLLSVTHLADGSVVASAPEGLLLYLTRLRLKRMPPPEEPCGIVMHQSAAPFKMHEKPCIVSLDCADLSDITSTNSTIEKLSSIQNFQGWLMEELSHHKDNRPSSPDLDGCMDRCMIAWVLPYISPLPLERVSSLLIQMSKRAMEMLTQATKDKSLSANHQFANLLYLLMLVETRWELFHQNGEHILDGKPFREVDVSVLLELASRFYLSDTDSAILALRCADIVFCARCFHPGSDKLSPQIEAYLPHLLTTLKSCSHQARLHSLRILSFMFGALRPLHKDDSELPNTQPAGVLCVLERCLRAERIRLDAQSVREFLIPILHLHSNREGVKDQPLSAQIVLHYLLGLLHIQLTSAWPGIQDALASFAELPKEQPSRVTSSKTVTTSMCSDGVEINDLRESHLPQEWRYVACRMYWSVLEPTIEEIAAKVIDINLKAGAETANMTVSESQNALALISMCRRLLCHKPDAEKLPILGNKQDTISERKPIDYSSYHLSLWRCLRPISAGKKTRFLTPILLTLLRRYIDHGLKKSDEEWLIVALDLFSKFHNIKSIYHEPEFRSIIYELLTNRRPSVQKAAFQCLLAYKNVALNNYSEHLEKIIDIGTFRDEIRTFKLDTAFEDQGHRQHVAPIFIRILYGRLQLSKGVFAPAVFTNLAACSESEFSLFLDLLLQPLLEHSVLPSTQLSASTQQLRSNQLVSFIQNLRDRVRASCFGQASVSWSQLQALSKVLNNVLDYMGYRLSKKSGSSSAFEISVSDDHLDVLFRLGLCLVAMSQTASEIIVPSCTGNAEDTEATRATCTPHPAQVKKVRATGIRLLEHVFNSEAQSTEFFTSEGRLEAVQHVCFYPDMIFKLLHSSTISVNHLLLTLAVPWSIYPHLAVRLLPGTAFETIIALLQSKQLNALVAERLIQIIHNVLFSNDMQHLGPELIRPYHLPLIQYLHDRMKQLSQTKNLHIFRQSKNKNEGLRLRQEFKILGHLATFTLDDSGCISPSEADWLLSGLLTLLTKCTIRASSSSGSKSTSNIRKPVRVNSDASAAANELQLATAEELEAELIHAVSRLAAITDHFEQHLTRILNLFARVNSRVCRGLLCQTVAACIKRLPSIEPDTLNQMTQLSKTPLRRTVAYADQWPNKCLPGHELCSDLLSRLNSWDKSRLDQPDAIRREHAFGLLGELSELIRLPESPAQTIYLHLGGLCCALHTIANADLQLRDAALDYCLRVSSAIQSVPDTAPFYGVLIQQCLWPGLLRLLRDACVIGPKRLHALRLLRGLIEQFRSKRLFAPMALLLNPDVSSNIDFYANLQSGTITRQAQAIRRLALFLRNPLTITSKRDLSRVKKLLHLNDSDFVIPERLLCDLFLPLVFFHLNPELHSPTEANSLLQEQKRLVEYSLDALGAIARRLSWNSYRKLMDSTLSKLSNAGNQAFGARLIMALIDAFVPPPWSDSLMSSCDKVPSGVRVTETPLAVNDEQVHTAMLVGDDHEEEVEKSEVTEEMPRISKTDQEITTTSKNQKVILSYMLNVVKRIQPLIAKSHKLANDTPAVRSKAFNIALVVSLVSLLKRLPSGYLVSRLPHLVLQVVDVLRPSPSSTPKIRADAIRSLTRVVRMLGPGKPLDALVTVVSQQLNRGYAAQQVRLFTLHKIIQEIEMGLIGGDLFIKPGQLDRACHIVGGFYLDELVGSLAEEMDSRRAAGLSLSSVHRDVRSQDVTDFQVSATGLGGSNTTDLPEANGLKAPEGLSRLCRLLSESGLRQLFDDMQKAILSAAAGSGFKLRETEDPNSSGTPIGCGIRFRSRALARLEVTLARLPTRSSIFNLKRYGGLTPEGLLSLATHIIQENISQVLSVDCKDEDQGLVESSSKSKTIRPTHGWTQPRSDPLEPRWNYLGLEAEPTRERTNDMLSMQSQVTQAHLLVSCGLHLLVGLLRYRWLCPDNPEHMSMLGKCVPLVLDCMRSKYVRVLGAALRSLNLFFVVATAKISLSLIPEFTTHLNTAGGLLFKLLATHPGLLSTKTAAADPYAQQFASNLYRALASLVRHQSTYPLSTDQLLTLLNAVDIELTRDAAATPSLSLLQAILQRRLRDPSLQKDEKTYLSFSGDMELQSSGLVVAKPSDRDQLSASGAGGGARLADLIQRLQSLAITSSSEHIRAEARCCLILFLLNYPHKAKFVQSFVAFCLRQLEYKKANGRSSALSLLTGLTADLPVARLTANHLDESILVSVGAAIERESVRALRVGMLALIRLLFTRLPPNIAEAHFRDYLLAFVTAPAATRTSARLLGLQMAGAVLDCQPSLTLTKYRPVLIKLLGLNVLPTAAEQLHQIVLTTPSVRQLSGLAPLFSSESICPAEEIARAQAAMDDASWVAELNCRPDDDVQSYSENVDSGSDSLESESEKEEEDINDEDHVSDDDDPDVSDSQTMGDREKMHFEQAEEQARMHCEYFVPEAENSHKASRSALDNHYLLVGCTLEYALRMVRRILDSCDTADSSEHKQLNENLLLSDSMIPIWNVITGHIESKYIKEQSVDDKTKRSKRRNLYARLLSSTDNLQSDSSQWSLLCAGHRGAREWATRCLAPLLRLESSANSHLLHAEDSESTESVPGGGKSKSAFFNQLRKKRKLRIALLERLTRDTVFQIEHDAKEYLNEEWSDTLIANAVHLGQLLHISAGRRPVLRLLRSANRIALDELNNRPQCYFQRTLALKLTTGLLLRLPRPRTIDLLEYFTVNRSIQSSESISQTEPSVTDGEKPKCPAYVSYLRAASRVIAREFRQRERLAFMAAASITTKSQGDGDDEADAAVARVRLGGVKLTKEQSARARARRRHAQARLRRALMSGTMRPETAQHLVASSAANRASAGPDQLVHVIEAAESTLIKELGDNGSTLVQLVCNQASRGAKARQHASSVNKATREALGVAWIKTPKRRRVDTDDSAKQPLKKRKQFNVEKDMHRKKRRESIPT